LTVEYKENDDVKLFCGMLDGLAFLPVDKVAEGMVIVKQAIPQTAHDKLQELVDYFDTTYVSGPSRRVQLPPSQSAVAVASVRLRRLSPLFSPALWNVHEATLTGEARTNNFCEGWNNGFHQMIGHSNPSVWTVIDSIRKDQALAATTLLQNEQGLRTPKAAKRATVEREECLRNICNDFIDGKRSVTDLLRSVGHHIRFV
jgi:hypothetical protein